MLARFESKFKKTEGCWIWLGTKDKNGYGIFKVSPHTTTTAHRMAYKLYTGEPGPHVRHLCHNRSCVNPGHLASGTAQDNTEDRVAIDPNFRKLCPAQIQEVLQMSFMGIVHWRIAKHFNCSQSTVSRAIRKHYPARTKEEA